MIGGMSRWQPNARGRLEQAAYELFLDQGYERTTVADIAKRAGLTERTFFRHYADKREVLFGGSAAMQDELLRALDHADLQERELIKRATLTAALAQALQQRGAPELAASLAADMGMAVFYVGFGHWLDDPADRELIEIVHDGFAQLKAVASGT